MTAHNKCPSTSMITKTIITSLFNEGRWQEALNAIENYPHTENNNESTSILNMQATVLANLGKLDEAINLCKASIKMDSTNIQVHYILAMALIEVNQLNEAEAELRKSIFLDKKFVEAHFQLGLLLLRTKKYDLGIKSLRNALTIAKTRDQTCEVTGFQGLDYARLTEILQRELELHINEKG
jgi:chemotaxis protein methyltransferase CheR